MSYLLDTNACIAVLNGQPAAVLRRLERALLEGSKVFVSSVAMFELWYGVFKSSRPDFNAKRLEAFQAGSVSLLAFDDEDAKVAGSIRATLESRGKPIGVYDLLLAAQALRSDLTLITANISEFSRVKGLTWQDWAKA